MQLGVLLRIEQQYKREQAFQVERNTSCHSLTTKPPAFFSFKQYRSWSDAYHRTRGLRKKGIFLESGRNRLLVSIYMHPTDQGILVNA